MNKDEPITFMERLSQQPLPIRIVAFSGFVLGALAIIFLASFGLYYLNVSNFPRLVPIALDETYSVAELALFEEADAYPAAVTVSLSGTAYTGSYLTGTVWRIAPDGSLSKLPQSREMIGSVIGLQDGNDSALYILDALSPLSEGNTNGAKIWRFSDETLSLLYEIPASGELSITQANDISLDSEGRIYIADILGRRIFRLEGETLSIFFDDSQAQNYTPAGLAYDAANNRILFTDAIRPEVHAIPVDAANPTEERELIYSAGEVDSFLGFNGIDISDTGIIYVAALASNQIWEIESAGRVIAENYRGASDVAYDRNAKRLIVNNWDQSWLAPIDYFGFQFTVQPRLPFSIDVINLASEE